MFQPGDRVLVTTTFGDVPGTVAVVCPTGQLLVVPDGADTSDPYHKWLLGRRHVRPMPDQADTPYILPACPRP